MGPDCHPKWDKLVKIDHIINPDAVAFVDKLACIEASSVTVRKIVPSIPSFEITSDTEWKQMN
jgi:hypothetical protein